MAGLNEFLDDEPQATEPAAVVVVEAEREPVATEVVPEPAAVEPEDEPSAAADGRVPVGVVAAIRKEKNDHKGRADRLEGEVGPLREQVSTLTEQIAAFQAQLAAVAKPPALPAVTASHQPDQLPPLPNPAEFPEEYAAAVRERLLQDVFQQRLDFAKEDYLKTKSPEDLDALIAAWGKVQGENPGLLRRLRVAPDPLAFAADQVEQANRRAERLAPDYEAKKEAEIEARVRAKLLEEYGGTPPVQAAPVVLPRSLATERSAAPRNTQAEAVPEFEDIFNRKKRA